MKHLMVVTTSFPDVAFQAGQEAAGMFVYDFVVELARWVRVTTVAPTSSPQANSERIGSLTICRFPVPSLPLSLLKPTHPKQWSNILSTMRSGQRAVEHVVQREHVDHIFALWALPSGYWAKVAGDRYGAPYSIWALGSDIWSLGRIPLIKNFLRDVLRHSRHRFADGYQLADDVKRLSGMDCAFLPSTRQLPITSAKTLATAPPYKLAFLGRWHPHKGTDLLLESLSLLTDEDWARIAAVKICGGGPLAGLVEEQGARLQANGHPVTIRGYLNRQEAADLLLWADYLLLPSRIESIPVIFSDAMQTNCPVVATPVGDLPRLMGENKIGTLADSVTVVAYTHAIQKALEMPPATYNSGLAHVHNQFKVTTSVTQLLNYLGWTPQQ
jgi:glycosyltransferase involved in cell wall biosynthesis